MLKDVCLGNKGHYLGAGQTLEVMQTEYIYPELGDRLSPNEWAEQGKPVLLEKALARKKEILDNYFPSHVSDEVDRQIREQFQYLSATQAFGRADVDATAQQLNRINHMKSHARVVIIGGGSLGVNLLYHLTKEGWTDVVLVEKGELTSGSTWHAAGLCSNFIGNHTVAQIHDYTIKLYNEILPEETGEKSVFHQCGSIRQGFTRVEEEWFRNLESRSKNIGFEFNIISKDEAQKLNPLMNFDKARIIVSTPNDGHVDPTSVVMPLSKLARKNGAEIYRNTRVTAINELRSGEWEVVTENGNIIAEHVVNAGGCFAREVGAMVGINVPLVNLEHQYLVTETHPDIAALDFELPVCRDSYSSAYIRQEGTGFPGRPLRDVGLAPLGARRHGLVLRSRTVRAEPGSADALPGALLRIDPEVSRKSASNQSSTGPSRIPRTTTFSPDR